VAAAEEVARQLEAGTVWVNSWGKPDARGMFDLTLSITPLHVGERVVGLQDNKITLTWLISIITQDSSPDSKKVASAANTVLRG